MPYREQASELRDITFKTCSFPIRLDLLCLGYYSRHLHNITNWGRLACFALFRSIKNVAPSLLFPHHSQYYARSGHVYLCGANQILSGRNSGPHFIKPKIFFRGNLYLNKQDPIKHADSKINCQEQVFWINPRCWKKKFSSFIRVYTLNEHGRALITAFVYIHRPNCRD